MKKLLFYFLSVACIAPVWAQYVNPHVSWHFSAEKKGPDQYDLLFKATIAPGFHLYSQYIEEGGPIPTSFSFEPSKGYRLVGKVKEEGNRKEAQEPVFDNMTLIWFEQEVTFRQRVQLTEPEATVSGYITFMTCDDKQCDPPSDQPFSFKLIGEPVVSGPVDTARVPAVILEPPTQDTAKAVVAPMNQATVLSDDVRHKSYWGTFVAGFVTGLIALLFPCVWPVIPLTVSYFLKQNKSQPSRGRWHAVLYALSITVIFVVLGVFISLVTNSQKLNELSTGWFFNMLFFVLFFLFGLSFLGVFEITLPSAWINRSEKLSEHGGLIGIFFMAFTLVLVSFSCTLPFVANLISLVTIDGEFARPLIGFTAFGLALGLPFGLLAWFPTVLHKLPKSGNWMHTLKVSFGFIEIALSFIYLSKVDMAYHWNFLSRDVFLAIWIILFGVLGLYLLGKIRLSAEDDVGAISVGRLLIAMFFLSFALYMIPGLWGAPLKPLSAFLPNYSEFKPHETAIVQATKPQGRKYADLFEAPHGLNMYFDYHEALQAARKEGKPLFVDFTGWGCVNCRKMEKTVWADPQVLTRLANNFITVSLYVDDRTPLPAEEQYYSTALKKKVLTLGDKNFDIQYSRFKVGAQPFYVILDGNENLLVDPVGYTPDVAAYVRFLDSGRAAFEAALQRTAAKSF
ncbi:MAG: thioredoxin family protein [Chitinophagales bacterium]|nr:thioredoxin family protein [Chitinophagales bacterium]MDW8427106.1 thioredoxin family protein [Chitinophagales bacterium]